MGAGGPGTINQTGGTIISLLSDTWSARVQPAHEPQWRLGGSERGSHQSKQWNRWYADLNGGTLTATEVTTGNARWQQHAELQQRHANRSQRRNGNFLHDLTTANVMSGGAIIDAARNTSTSARRLLTAVAAVV